MNGIIEVEIAELKCESCHEIGCRDKSAFLIIERVGLKPLCKPCLLEHVREGLSQVSVVGT